MGTPRKRTRSQLYPQGRIGTIETIDTWNGRVISSIPVSFGAAVTEFSEACYDELHPTFRKGKRSYREHLADIGGPLDIRTLKVTNALTGSMAVGSTSGVYRYKGQFVNNKIPSGLTIPDTCLGLLLPYSATGWHKFKPGKPQASLGVFLGELPELPKMLWDTLKVFRRTWKYIRPIRPTSMGPGGKPYNGSTWSDAQVLSRDYLSYQFGWLPFVRDVMEMLQLHGKLKNVLGELRANNGVWRRRGGTVAKSQTSVVEYQGTDYGALYPILPSPCYVTVPTYIRTRQTSMRVWFKGAYRYYIPELGVKDGSVPWNTIRRLYGLTFTPDVMWNLIPWSWLVDWFHGVGKTLAFLNDGAAENLASKHAYVMGTWKTTVTHGCSAQFGKGGTVSLNTTVEWEQKGRLKASPFGLATAAAPLSERQWSILAALGISRAK